MKDRKNWPRKVVGGATCFETINIVNYNFESDWFI